MLTNDTNSARMYIKWQLGFWQCNEDKILSKLHAYILLLIRLLLKSWITDQKKQKLNYCKMMWSCTNSMGEYYLKMKNLQVQDHKRLINWGKKMNHTFCSMFVMFSNGKTSALLVSHRQHSRKNLVKILYHVHIFFHVKKCRK